MMIFMQKALSHPKFFGVNMVKELIGSNHTQKSKIHLIKNNISIQWFEDGTLNISANCIDRHLEDNSQKKAIIWESDDGEVTRIYTYQQLYEEVSKFGNVLKKSRYKKG